MKKLITLLFALIAIASTLVAQDQVPNYLCFKRVRATESKLVFSWGNCGTDELKTNISYSIDAKHWNKFTVSSWQCHSPTHSIDGPRWYTVSVTTDCNVARELYLKSSNIVQSEEIFSFGYSHLTIIPYIYSVEKLGDIYVSGNFNALLQDPYDFENNYENWTSRTVNSTAWDIVFCAGEKHQNQYTGSNRNKGLRNQVVGVDMSFFDPISEMYQGWTKLSWIKVKFDSWGKNGYNNWVKGVATEGVFICPRELDIKYGYNYIPENWRVVYLDELRTINIPDSLKDYIKIDKTEDIIPNSNIKFTVNSPKGYSVAEVTVSGSDQRPIPVTKGEGLSSYSFIMPKDDATINVVYTPIKYSITTNAYCSANKSEAFMNDEIVITILDKVGYEFVSASYSSTYNTKVWPLNVIDKKGKFTMPAENVTVKTIFKPIQYDVATDAYVTADKSIANTTEQVTFMVKDRTADGYKLDKVLVNDKKIEISNYKGSFLMKDYLANVTIKAVYSPITSTDDSRSISTDEYSQTDKTKCNAGDVVNVTFTKREGYNLTSATFNGKALTINNYKSSFTMPAQDVVLESIYTPIEYAITCADKNVSVNKPKATIADNVTFTIVDRSADGYKLDKVTINGKAISFSGYKGSFAMKDYMTNVTIKAVYSQITSTDESRNISTDEYSHTDKTKCNVGDVVNVTFTKREGYNLTSATYNGKALTITDYSASFTMPSEDVVIKTVYTPIGNSQFNPLCFEVKAGTKVSLKKYGKANPNIQYSYDKTTWNDFAEVTVNNDCRIYFRGENPNGFSTSYNDYSSFEVSKEFKCSGNVMSLIDGKGETLQIPSNKNGYCCFKLFENCPLTTAPELPATTLANYCYDEMFSGCTKLTTAPVLPATNLATWCYYYMFSGCTSLTTAPNLPATILKDYCYKGMFCGCTSLTSAPELPATTLTSCCYEMMFSSCEKLTTPPNLPATTLANWCYSDMFFGCTSLTTAPNLSATTLTKSCYYYMFRNCTNLTSAPKLSATTLAEDCYCGMFTGCRKLQSITVDFNSWPENGCIEWVEYVSAKGVFICPSDLPQKFGINYIPEGWIVNPRNNNFAISSKNEFVTIDKTSAKYNDKVNFSIIDRTSDGYKLDKVLVNNKEVAVSNYAGSFDMMDYLTDVTITAQYSKIPYTITTDEYSQVANTSANVDDAITVTFKQREGYDLTSATYNGNPLNINGYKATFTMPAQNVEIKAVYTGKVYEIEKPSEGVSVSQPSAKAGDEITISVNPKDGYTVHLYINGAEVALSGNSAVYTMPSGKIEITVNYVVDEKTPVAEIELENCTVSVFPNPAKSGEKITLKVGGKFDTNNTNIYIYNASGSLVMQIDNVKEYNQLTLQSGVYVGVLVTKGGKKTFRVAVK